MKRLVLLLGVLVGSLATAGCRSDSVRCEDICVTADDCDDGVNIDHCIDQCLRHTDDADDGCMTSYAALADCMAVEDHDCPDTIDSCDSEIEDFFEDCEDDFEHFEYANIFIEAVDDNPEPF